MKETLKKLKLIEYHTTELEIQKKDFVARLKQNVDKGDLGAFSDMFDIFSSSKNEYKGSVDNNGFKIKRRKKLFDTNMNLAIATGTFEMKGDTLVISTEINGFHRIFIPFYIFVTIVYSIFIFAFLFLLFQEGAERSNEFFLGIPFILIHATFMYGLPYFMMRRSTSRMKRELEREFFYMTKK